MNTFHFDQFQRGAVRCIFSDHVESTAVAVEQWMEGIALPVRLHLQRYASLPAHAQLRREFVMRLAEAARFLWPEWFDAAPPEELEAEDLPKRVESWAAELQRQLPGTEVDPQWLRGAVRACLAGTAPFLSKPPLAAQARQLARAITGQDLLIAVALEDDQTGSARLLSFSRSLEWLARSTAARVIALLPRKLAGRHELDGINSQALYWEVTSERAVPRKLDDEPPPAEPDDQQDERKHLACPILGRPHPASPGEQLLAAQLKRDPELSELFGFNERVTTRFGTQPLVDLLWSEGRVVVEVDGYGYHTTRAAFYADRHRDYELQLSGYLVLRLPHDSVIQDVELAVERIRECVVFRRQLLFHEK